MFLIVWVESLIWLCLVDKMDCVWYIVIGVGVIGGVVGGVFVEVGQDVVLVVWGVYGVVIWLCGLLLCYFDCDVFLLIVLVELIVDVDLWVGDVVFFVVKLQQIVVVFDELLFQSVEGVFVGEVLFLFCLQNGIVNEDVVLCEVCFVYGVCVNFVVSFLQLGVVDVFGFFLFGILEFGFVIGGSDDVDWVVVVDFIVSGFIVYVCENVMVWKVVKLLCNFGNVLQVLFGLLDEFVEWDVFVWIRFVVQMEGCVVFVVVGREVVDDDSWDVVFLGLGMVLIYGCECSGGFIWQSFECGMGEVEIGYFNGEIVCVGCWFGILIFVNEVLVVLMCCFLCVGGVFGMVLLSVVVVEFGI